MIVREPVLSLSLSTGGLAYEIQSLVESLEYVDKLHGESGELNVQLMDRPSHGVYQPPMSYPFKYVMFSQIKPRMEVSGSLGFRGEPRIAFGTLVVDEVMAPGGPDTVSMRCQSAAISKGLRTRKQRGHHSTNLKALHQKIAQEHGLTPVALEIPEVAWERSTQLRETDLEYLQRQAERWGCAVHIHDGKLVMAGMAYLLDLPPAFRIPRRYAISFNHRFQTMGTGKAIRVQTYHEDARERHWAEAEMPEDMAAADTRKVYERTENLSQAEKRATGEALHTRAREVEANLTLIGDARLVAGIRITLEDFGVFDGDYLIKEARHRFSRPQGYTTEVVLARPSDQRGSLPRIQVRTQSGT